MRRLRWIAGPLIAAIVFAVALLLLRRELHDYRYPDIIQSLSAIPKPRILMALLLTVAAYFVQTGYDTLAMRYLGKPLPYRRIALASFIGYAFNNNFGLSGLIGGSLRYRLYTAWRLSAVEVAKVIAFCSGTLWLGFASVGSAAFLFLPPLLSGSVRLPVSAVRALGVILMLALGGYLVLTVRRKAPVVIRGWEFSLPAPRIALAQIVVSSLDWTLAGLILLVLLDSPELSFFHLLSAFLLAQLIGLLSNVPGGLGVFETALLLLLSPAVPPKQVLGALLAYRGIYYLLPLAGAIVLLTVHEILARRERVAKVARLFGRWAPGLVPTALAFTTFVGGSVLLFSGATPMELGRARWLEDFLPLPVIELSHFLGSVAGVALLFLARGLQRRLDAAWVLAAILLAGGAIWSLLKGFDWEEALILTGMLAALLPARRQFYRRASLVNEPFTLQWLVAIGLIVGCSIWLGLFSFKHVEYTSDLWWRFSARADAPRFLRATAGAIAAALAFAVARLLRPSAPEPELPVIEEIERVRSMVATSTSTSASLALLGDKRILFSERGEGFLMYAVEGRSWVSMGDPIGGPEERRELAWRFREISDRHNGWAVFYEAHRDSLPLYIDLGLNLIKLGEEARVPLPTFSLEGGSRKQLRKTRRQIEAEGCAFEVLPREEVSTSLPHLKAVSDSWKSGKRVREKGFSLGFFSEDYIRQFPCAIVRRNEAIVAFANLWTAGSQEELSVDLMRHSADAPSGVMDYLFTEVMLWGRERGYRWFDLGMAPLSGVEDRALGPLWNRLASLAWRHGEHFYNFQGLRQYKEKFDPVWEPTYLAAPGGLALPVILANVATLISGGIRGIFAR